MLRNKKNQIVLFVLFLITSCTSSVELTNSWVNKNAHVKKSPKVMVMALGNSVANRSGAEKYIVAEMQKGGHNAIAALDILSPDVKHYDSLALVNLLRQNNVDMLLTNAIIDIKETQRYVPGTTETVPVGSAPVPAYNSNYGSSYNYPYYYGGYYNYYDNRTTYYQTTYETRTTPGYTVTDIVVLIESNLYDVATSSLLWVGQSRTFTKEPSAELFDDFAKVVVADITKNNFLQK